jgi:hypothetical protein
MTPLETSKHFESVRLAREEVGPVYSKIYRTQHLKQCSTLLYYNYKNIVWQVLFISRMTKKNSIDNSNNSASEIEHDINGSKLRYLPRNV